MSEDQHSPPHRRASDETEGVCAIHGLQMKTLTDGIKEIKETSKDTKDTVGRIETALEKGDGKFDTFDLRIRHVETVVYGAAGTAGLALLGAILALVLKRGA